MLLDDYVDFSCAVNGGTPTPSLLSLPVFYEESGKNLIEEFEVCELFGFKSTENTTRAYIEEL
jgi:hypothetical protein